ncbi:MAG: hypothetical protein AAF499_00280 [Pseudomonadota bacterium]
MVESDSSSGATARARDVWAALVLMGVSLFFLWKTTDIPLFGENRAGVSGTDWFTSAALVPLGIFGAMFALACVLLVIGVRGSGWRVAFSFAGLGISKTEFTRVLTVLTLLAAYIIALVPRVDFILSSALLITALVFGFYGGHPKRSALATVFVITPALYAWLQFREQRSWGAHSDDWVTLAAWIGLVVCVLVAARRDPVLRRVPVLAIVAPTVLVCAMAFGFRQNVPARTGLVFQQLEYHYFVSLKPLWTR